MAVRDLTEFREHWRPFVACFLGMGSALSVNNFITSTFAPYLLQEFGWTRAQWATTGMFVILLAFCVPVAGRLADLYGVRRVAGVGVVVFPLTLVAVAMLQGDIRQYMAIVALQSVLCCTTTATIYTRLVAEKFVAWRGLALAMCAASPAMVGMVAAPAITAFVHAHGWRNGYLMVAAISALCGALAMALTPPHRRGESASASRGPVGYGAILRSPVFWIMLFAGLLVSMHHTLIVVQMKVLLLEQGVSDTSAAWLVAVFAGGSIAGRLLSGVALDFLPAHSVAAVFLGLPVIGLLMLASDADSVAALAVAILLVGMAFGGEGDVIAYLVVRFFGIGVFSTVLGLLTTAIATASALGAALLGVSLKLTDSFNAFLMFAALCVFAGSALFQLLGAERYQRLVLR